MKCDKFHEKIIDLIYGGLPREEEEELMAHLAECDECARDFEELKKTAILIRALPDPPAPVQIDKKIMDLVRASQEEPPSIISRLDFSYFMSRPLATAAVAIIGLGLVFAVGWFGGKRIGGTDKADMTVAMSTEDLSAKREAAPPPPERGMETRKAKLGLAPTAPSDDEIKKAEEMVERALSASDEDKDANQETKAKRDKELEEMKADADEAEIMARTTAGEKEGSTAKPLILAYIAPEETKGAEPLEDKPEPKKAEPAVAAAPVMDTDAGGASAKLAPEMAPPPAAATVAPAEKTAEPPKPKEETKTEAPKETEPAEPKSADNQPEDFPSETEGAGIYFSVIIPEAAPAEAQPDAVKTEADKAAEKSIDDLFIVDEPPIEVAVAKVPAADETVPPERGLEDGFVKTAPGAAPGTAVPIGAATPAPAPAQPENVAAEEFWGWDMKKSKPSSAPAPAAAPAPTAPLSGGNGPAGASAKDETASAPPPPAAPQADESEDSMFKFKGTIFGKKSKTTDYLLFQASKNMERGDYQKALESYEEVLFRYGYAKSGTLPKPSCSAPLKDAVQGAMKCYQTLGKTSDARRLKDWHDGSCVH